MLGLCPPARGMTWVERPLNEQSSGAAFVPLPPSPQRGPTQSEERSPLSHSPEVSGRSSGSPGQRDSSCGQQCWDVGGSPGLWGHVNHPISYASASLPFATGHWEHHWCTSHPALAESPVGPSLPHATLQTRFFRRAEHDQS